MRLAVPATLATAAVLVAGALIPEPPRALQVLVASAMLGALGAAGDRLARRLCPDFGLLSRGVAAFSFAVALAVVPATWMGHFGVMRPAPFLIWTAAALLLSRLLPAPAPAGRILSAADRWTRAEWALVLAAGAAVALLGLNFAFDHFWAPVGLGPDDESYHLAAMAVWHRFGDLRMIKFAMGDTSTTFYPVGGEVWSWVLLAPFRDSDVLARWAQLPFAVAAIAATAAIGRRLGLSRRSALMAALLFAAIKRSFPVLAFTAGNDHSGGFFTLAAIDAALALAAQPAAGLAVYAGATLGLLLGTKYIGLLFAPVILAVLVLAGLGRRWASAPGERLPLRALAGLGLLLAATGAVAGGYTYLRNWVTAGNPIFPAPLSLFGHSILPGWEGSSLESRRHSADSQIDVWKFLLDRRDLLGSFFPYTMLPAAFAAPLVALWRRRGEWWRDALVLLLPVVFFLEFLDLMHDHRDMRYFLPGVALAAVAFAWLVEQAGPRASPLRAVLLLVLTFHVARKLDLDGTVAALVALALLGLGWLAVRQGPRLVSALARPSPRRWLAAGAAATVLLGSLPLAALVTRYQAEKLFLRPPALALERLAGPDGAAVAYVGLNKPYTFFGSRLQNDVRIVPRHGELEDQYYQWGGTVDFPYEGDSYLGWRRRLGALDVDFVVVHRSPSEDPERDWMEGRPRAFRLEYSDPATEIWRVVPAQEIRRQRQHEEDSPAPELLQGHEQRGGEQGQDQDPQDGAGAGEHGGTLQCRAMPDRPEFPHGGVVAVDLRALVPAVTGIGVYTRSLLLGLAARGGLRYLGLAHRLPREAAELTAAGIGVEPQPSPLGVLWQQLRLPRRLARGDVDLFWSPLITLPLRCPVPAVATVHDLTALLLPEMHTLKVRWSLLPFLRLSFEQARQLVTISKATADDLAFHFPQCREKIRVVYPGIDPEFQPGAPAEIAATRAELGAPEGFILFVGTLEPRKNVGALLDAWESLRAENPRVPPLVLAGPAGWGSERLARRIQSLAPSGVQSLGRVERSRLVRLFQAARVFVYPSLYEGFGFPAAEALACGVPVVASASSSLPEVVGDAGLLVEPGDAGALAAKIASILENPGREAELRSRGPAQAARFRWDRAAREMEEVFFEAIG